MFYLGTSKNRFPQEPSRMIASHFSPVNHQRGGFSSPYNKIRKAKNMNNRSILSLSNAQLDFDTKSNQNMSFKGR